MTIRKSGKNASFLPVFAAFRDISVRIVRTTYPAQRAATARSKEAEAKVCERRCEERTVDDVEHPAEAGHELPAVLYARVALHQRFEQIARLSDSADNDAEKKRFPPEGVVISAEAR